MASFQNKRAQAKALQEMKSRVAELQARIAKDVDYAFEALLQVQPDLSLKMENDLEEVLRMAELIESELDEASGISELERLDRRIEFIEDRFEELEAELYSRPRRRRKRRPNLFEFFRQATGGGGWGGADLPHQRPLQDTPSRSRRGPFRGERAPRGDARRAGWSAGRAEGRHRPARGSAR